MISAIFKMYIQIQGGVLDRQNLHLRTWSYAK